MKGIKPCPECGSDLISVNSSRSMRISEIRCDDCGFGGSKGVNEERIIKWWNSLSIKHQSTPQ
jgi:transposase-like protein